MDSLFFLTEEGPVEYDIDGNPVSPRESNRFESAAVPEDLKARFPDYRVTQRFDAKNRVMEETVVKEGIIILIRKIVYIE